MRDNDAYLYDSAWAIAASVLETRSVNASVVAGVFPEVCSRLYGASGWCRLDQNGDRAALPLDVWFYARALGSTRVSMNPIVIRCLGTPVNSDTHLWGPKFLKYIHIRFHSQKATKIIARFNRGRECKSILLKLDLTPAMKTILYDSSYSLYAHTRVTTILDKIARAHDVPRHKLSKLCFIQARDFFF